VDEFPEIRPVHAEAMHRAGLTVCWKLVGLPRFIEFEQDLEQRLRLPGWSCNVYCSPDNDGFAIHYDRHATLIIQLSGAKEWWYSESATVPDPLKHHAHYTPPSRESLNHVTLEPGDILFMPPSCWHAARAKGSSLALTFAPRDSVGITKQILDATWQAAPMPALAPEDFGQQGIPQRARNHIEKELARARAALDELSVDDVWAHWFLNFAKPSPRAPRRAARRLLPSDELSMPADYPVSTASTQKNGAEQRAIHCNGTAVSIDPNAHVLLQKVYESRKLTGEELVKQLGSAIEWTDISPLLGELVELGILESNADRRPAP
jgi:hypothetical protein